jgi:hypothetical protein
MSATEMDDGLLEADDQSALYEALDRRAGRTP